MQKRLLLEPEGAETAPACWSGRANLARGAQQVIAIPDESALDLEREEWDRLGRAVKFVHLDLPCAEFIYHYRLIATIALAEVARQVGQWARPAPARPRRPSL